MCLVLLGCSEPTRWFAQTTPDENPRRRHLADGPLSSLYASSPTLGSFGAASVMMCCSARPASLRALSVLPEDRIGCYIKYIRRFCDHIKVFTIFDPTCIVSTLGWSTTGGPDFFSSSRVRVSPADATAKPMASSHHFTPLCQVEARLEPLV